MQAFLTSYLYEWLNLAIRWLHVVTAIAWIGESFHFVRLDNSLEPPQDPDVAAKGVAGELWAVHGGGFYNPQKYLVAPARLPQHLHWSKWPSYVTWLSGFALLSVLYLLQADTYLVDRSVCALSGPAAALLALGFLAGAWLLYDAACRVLGRSDPALSGAVGLLVVSLAYTATHLFAGRAAFILVGASLATMMTANVFFWIIPGQQRMVAAMRRGEAPDPRDGKLGKQRSVHNTYFTLPVVFCMISNHYGMTYSHPHSWAVLSCIMAGGALVRQFFVLRHRGKVAWPLVALALVLLLGAVVWTRPSGVRAAGEAVSLAEVEGVVGRRCVQCHSAKPTLLGVAPAGLMLDAPGAVTQNASRIYKQVVELKIMPLGNITQMTDEERQSVARWYETTK